MRRVIVTGGTGFIGSYVVKHLLEEGAEVSLLVRNPGKVPEDIRERVQILEGTIEHALDVREKLRGRYDCCYHLAWAGVAPEEKNNIELQMNNIRSAMEVLKLAKEAGCSRFLMAGTVAEYTRCEDVMDTGKRQTPSDFYGAAKASSYYFLRVLAEQLGIGLVWTIVPSTYGPGRTDNNLLTYTIRTLLAGGKPSYGSLTQQWDFLYVEEVARGIVYVGEKGTDGKVYGIGSGTYRPLKEYVCMIRDIIDSGLPLGIGEHPQLSGRVYSSCVDNQELCRDTGFVPEENFEENIRKTIAWYKSVE